MVYNLYHDPRYIMPTFPDFPEENNNDNVSRSMSNQMVYPTISYRFIQQALSISVPIKAEYFSIVLFEKAKGFVRIDEELHLIGRKTALVVFPGQCIIYSLREGTTAHHLVASKNIYETISSISNLYVGKSRPVSFFELTDHNFILLLHEYLEVKRLLESENREESLIVNRFKTVYLMLKSMCMQLREYNFSQVNNPIISQFIKLIDLHYKNNREVAFYADMLHIHPNYLNILCKKTLHITAKGAIKNKVVLEAKSLLVGSNLSVKEISYSLGMDSAPHFTAFFKKETGFTPKEFLKLREKNFGN